MAGFIDSLGSSVPWIVAIVGWGFTHVFSEARERRKEARAQLDKLYEQLYVIEKLAQDFHCAEKFAEAKASELLAKFQVFERTISRLPILNIDNLVGHIVSLRRAVTLSNFDRSSFVQQPYECDIAQDIFSASQNMEDALEGQYQSRYPSKMPFFRLGHLKIVWKA